MKLTTFANKSSPKSFSFDKEFAYANGSSTTLSRPMTTCINDINFIFPPKLNERYVGYVLLFGR